MPYFENMAYLIKENGVIYLVKICQNFEFWHINFINHRVKKSGLE